MKLTIKCLDVFDILTVGATYEVKPEGRFVHFRNIATGSGTSLYHWQVTQGLTHGKLAYVDLCQSPAMSCTAVAQLCHRLDSGYAY